MFLSCLFLFIYCIWMSFCDAICVETCQKFCVCYVEKGFFIWLILWQIVKFFVWLFWFKWLRWRWLTISEFYTGFHVLVVCGCKWFLLFFSSELCRKLLQIFCFLSGKEICDWLNHWEIVKFFIDLFWSKWLAWRWPWNFQNFILLWMFWL